MATSTTHPLPSCTTFGELLHYLRRRARLSQRELSIAVGYSESMISRLEHNERPPDMATLLAVFVPALDVANEPEIIAQLTTLALAARGEAPAASKQVEAPETTSAPPSLPITVRMPQRLTSFIGREAEVEAGTRLLAQTRLVTLTGPGGCGKTSLAIEIGRAMAEWQGEPTNPKSKIQNLKFTDGIYLVELAPLTDPALLAQSILLALGVEGNREWVAAETLLSFLGSKQTLLVLDNCEHLIDATAHLVEALLRTCPNLRILVTSRERLNIPGEMLFNVPSLAFPDPQMLPDLAVLPHFAAIQLFVERSQRVVPDFRLTTQNAPAVAKICARLDGIPLALELASAALLTFSVQEIAERSDERFLLSIPGYRTANPRQQTINNTVAWSYNLLSSAEQRLLVCLSVFVGGWMLDALQYVCQDQDDLVLCLQQLIQKSLVRVEHVENYTRYRLLRSIGDYATERLQESGNMTAIRFRHFIWFSQLAEELGRQVLGTRHHEAMASLDADFNNIRAAFINSKGDAALAETRLRMAAALPYYWHLRSGVVEGLSWLHDTLVNEALLPPATRALAYVALLNMNSSDPFHWNMDIGDLAESERLVAVADALIEPCLAQGESLAAAHLMTGLSGVYQYRGNLAKAKEYAESALRRFEALDDRRNIGLARNQLVWSILMQGDTPVAAEMVEENIRFLQQSGMTWGLCEAFMIQAECAMFTNDRPNLIQSLERLCQLAEREAFTSFLHFGFYILEIYDSGQAITLAEQFLARQRQPHASEMQGLALHQLGRMYLNAQQFDQAQTTLDEAIAFWRRFGTQRGQDIGLSWSLLDRAQTARFLGEHDQAMTFFQESIALFSVSSFAIKGAFPLLYRGHQHLAKNDLNAALNDFRQCIHELTNGGRRGWRKLIIGALTAIGEIARVRGNLSVAAKLFAFGFSNHKYFSNLFSECVDYNRILAIAATFRQDPVFAAAWQEGEKLSLDEAITLALAD